MKARIAPAPSSGRKPQAGDSQRPVIGPRLSHILDLARDEPALVALKQQERTLYYGPAGPSAPRPLTSGVRIPTAADPPPAAQPPASFDPARPNVAIAFEFYGAEADLPQLGALSAARAGDFFVGWANLDRVETLAQHPAMRRMELLRKPAQTSSGSTSPAAPAASPATAPAPGRPTGRGVDIAVVDLGFDFLHPSFLRLAADGTEAVRAGWLYDTTLSPAPGADPASIGRRFSQADLQAGLDWYKGAAGPPPESVALHMGRLRAPALDREMRADLQQHGTAVAGVAAGNGRGGPPGQARPGFAPECGLLLIATGLHDETRFADSPQIAAAFVAAFEETETPCVALMANSDNLGPHDGSLCGERLLDELLLIPGRAIVLTAGNLNHPQAGAPDAAWHAVAGPPAPGAVTTLQLRVAAGAMCPDCAEIWFSPRQGQTPTARISCSGGVTLPPVSLADSAAPVTLLTPAQNPRTRTTAQAQLQFDAVAGCWCLRLTLLPPDDEVLLASLWTLAMEADGAVHGWVDRNNEGLVRWEGDAARAGAAAITLGSPDAALRAITVGSVGVAADGIVSISDFSGRGPVRLAPHAPQLKPDLVAVGQGVTGPLGQPEARLQRQAVPPESAFCGGHDGTSFAAPQVAGACALLFEHFGADPVLGPVAGWADVRQKLLQNAARPAGLPAADTAGWEPAGGHGLLDLDALFDTSAPDCADVWLQKSATDTGLEPYVAANFWNSPVLLLEAEAGQPTRVRVRVGNRGQTAATDVTVCVWWSELGVLYPLPHPTEGGPIWHRDGFSSGGAQRVEVVPAGGVRDAVFDWTPPRAAAGHIVPHMLLATVSTDDDPYDPAGSLCEQNNVAALCVDTGLSGADAVFTLFGTDDTDGIAVWGGDAAQTVRIEEFPVTALPWRDATLFVALGGLPRPLYGASDQAPDPALPVSVEIEDAAAIAALTDAIGVRRLIVRDGRATMEAVGRILLPRLRLQPGARLEVRVSGGGAGPLHLLHLSGGRRVGGATILE